MTDPYDVLHATNRMWIAAYELDKLLGHTKASEYVARRVAPMVHLDLEDCLEPVTEMADKLEKRLERERGTTDTEGVTNVA